MRGHAADSQNKMGEIAPGVPPVPKRVFFLSPIQRDLSATYHAPISTTFEIKDANRCPHACAGEKFPNFCAGVFRVPKQLKMDTFEGVLVSGYSSNGTLSGDGNHFGG